MAKRKIPIATIIAITKTTKIITGKPWCSSVGAVTAAASGTGAAAGCSLGTCQGSGALDKSGRDSATAGAGVAALGTAP